MPLPDTDQQFLCILQEAQKTLNIHIILNGAQPKG